MYPCVECRYFFFTETKDCLAILMPQHTTVVGLMLDLGILVSDTQGYIEVGPQLGIYHTWLNVARRVMEVVTHLKKLPKFNRQLFSVVMKKWGETDELTVSEALDAAISVNLVIPIDNVFYRAA